MSSSEVLSSSPPLDTEAAADMFNLDNFGEAGLDSLKHDILIKLMKLDSILSQTYTSQNLLIFGLGL